MLTGHRPEKLGGYKPNPIQNWVIEQLDALLKRALHSDPKVEVISGMALGADQWWATCAIRQGIPVHAFIPFEGYYLKWPETSMETYKQILSQCVEVKICCPPGYQAEKMQIRNELMVMAATHHVAIWDGSSGGTANAVKYIKQQGLKYYRINPITKTQGWIDQK